MTLQLGFCCPLCGFPVDALSRHGQPDTYWETTDGRTVRRDVLRCTVEVVTANPNYLGVIKVGGA